jgi:hypothetical protein
MAGGKGSLGGATGAVAGFLRKVKNPTRMGIRIKIRATHSIAKPQDVAIVPVVVFPAKSVTLYGIFPVAVTAPKTHRNSPGQPHNSTAAMVAIIAVVRFSMVLKSSSIKFDTFPIY